MKLSVMITYNELNKKMRLRPNPLIGPYDGSLSRV